jgi:hypothetical protein
MREDYLAEIFALLGIWTISLSCATFFGCLYLSIVELSGALPLGGLFLHVDGIYLVNRVLSCYLVELVRKFSAFVGNFFLFHVVLV